MNAYIKKTERFQINYLMLHLKLLEKWEQAKPKTRRREIIKIRAKINVIETKKKIQRINETKSLFFEKINKIDTDSWQIWLKWRDKKPKSVKSETLKGR
jgi:cytidylate kinase